MSRIVIVILIYHLHKPIDLKQYSLADPNFVYFLVGYLMV
jgi:hypothetical protein